ncbi:MAG: hypothetical protein M1812_005911 [Candelaria pacifica]|nr:MAG: hypothetical protein M1812_005911 [Candelaria pacifica]
MSVDLVPQMKCAKCLGTASTKHKTTTINLEVEAPNAEKITVTESMRAELGHIVGEKSRSVEEPYFEGDNLISFSNVHPAHVSNAGDAELDTKEKPKDQLMGDLIELE